MGKDKVAGLLNGWSMDSDRRHGACRHWDVRPPSIDLFHKPFAYRELLGPAAR